MAVSRSNTFDGGTNGVAISDVNSGGVSGDAFSATGQLLYSSAQVYPGGLSAQHDGSGSVGFTSWTGVAPVGDTVYTRYYLRITSYPGSAFTLLQNYTGTGNSITRVDLLTDGKLQLLYSTSDTVAGTSSTVVPLNQWVRIETRTTTQSPGVANVWLYLNPDSVTHTDAIAATPNLGTTKVAESVNALTGGWFMDSLALAETQIGPAIVPRLSPPPINVTAAAVARASRW